MYGMNCYNRIAATLYILRNRVYFRHVSVNTLHKGDNMMMMMMMIPNAKNLKERSQKGTQQTQDHCWFKKSTWEKRPVTGGGGRGGG
jgi:type III secretory pathway component EscR